MVSTIAAGCGPLLGGRRGCRFPRPQRDKIPGIPGIQGLGTPGLPSTHIRPSNAWAPAQSRVGPAPAEANISSLAQSDRHHENRCRDHLRDPCLAAGHRMTDEDYDVADDMGGEEAVDAGKPSRIGQSAVALCVNNTRSVGAGPPLTMRAPDALALMPEAAGGRGADANRGLLRAMPISAQRPGVVFRDWPISADTLRSRACRPSPRS
jgi:hypothetical protein